jgi:hypothetical protein
MRRGSRPKGSDPRVRPRTGTVKRRETGTALDYGPGIYIRIRIPYRTVCVRFLMFFFGAKVRKLLNDRIRVQYSDPDLPELVRSHPAIAFS